MSDFLSGQTGIAARFGGFAATPGGQAQYMARQHNPYAFLQRSQPVDTSTAPAAADQMLAGGGLVSGLTTQQMMQWSRFMRSRAKGGYRRGGLVPCFDEGGDTGSDTGNDTGQGTSASSGFDGPGVMDSSSPGATSSGASAFDAPGGLSMDPGGFSTSSPSATGATTSNSPFDQAGITSGQQLGFNNEDPSLASIGFNGLMSGLVGTVPGLGAVNSALGLSSKASNAIGLDPMGPGASKGASIGAAVGGMFGPGGAALGSMIGAEAGAHGQMGAGALGGTGSTAGTSGAAVSNGPTMSGTGFNSDIGMDGPSLGSQVGLGGPSGNNNATATNDVNDTAALIAKFNKALGIKDSTQNLASGGRVQGGGPNHNFHKGSGLVHGASDGRADALQTQVPPGGYVVPADVVSGLGEGNTMSGAKKLRGMMPQQAPSFATGGAVPVRLSAGEFYVHPAHVAALGNGSLKAGSDKLDTMVGHVRRASVRQTASLPPPK